LFLGNVVVVPFTAAVVVVVADVTLAFDDFVARSMRNVAPTKRTRIIKTTPSDG
jgi:hypothetical protein